MSLQQVSYAGYFIQSYPRTKIIPIYYFLNITYNINDIKIVYLHEVTCTYLSIVRLITTLYIYIVNI